MQNDLGVPASNFIKKEKILSKVRYQFNFSYYINKTENDSKNKKK
jgi:hypothetical protein